MRFLSAQNGSPVFGTIIAFDGKVVKRVAKKKKEAYNVKNNAGSPPARAERRPARSRPGDLIWIMPT